MKHKNLNILYVENDEQTRKKLSQLFSKYSRELFVVQSGREALNIYKNEDISIVIASISLPDMSGIEMIRQIKLMNEKQAVIFTVSNDDKKYLFEAIELQVDGYVTKPIDIEKVKSRLENCIGKIDSEKLFKKLQESEAKFEIISQNSEVGIFIYQEKVSYVNEALCRMLGYTKDELLSMKVWSLVEETLQKKFKEVVKRRIVGERFSAHYTDIPLIKKDGTVIRVRAGVNTIEYQGSYAGIGIIMDVTDLIYTKKHLKQLVQAIDQMDQMVRISDTDGKIIYVNKALTKFTGYKEEELLGQSNKLFKSGEHNDSFYKKMYKTIYNKKSFKAVFINAKKSGELYYEDQIITPLLDEETEEIEYFVSTSKDITKEIQLQERMKSLATTDTLTGIKNRYSMNESITSEINKLMRYGGEFALMMLDIDHFKRVNDDYGHDVGDYVLQEFTAIVNSLIRETDTFGRWGGEEFLLLAPNENKAGAMQLAEKIRSRVSAHKFDKVGHISISIGLSTCNKHSNKDKLLKNIDEALYEAKTAGRDKVVYHECTCAFC